MLDQAQQLDQALRNYWHPVAVSEEVTAEPLQVRLLGEAIVLYRDPEGLVALRDKCVHRGVALSGGCIRDGRLMCPYHGWQYDRSGARWPTSPPWAPNGAIPSQARVNCHHVREAHGAVWVVPAEPRSPDLPPVARRRLEQPRLARVPGGHLASGRPRPGRMIENAIDFAHFNFVHRGLHRAGRRRPSSSPSRSTPTDDGMSLRLRRHPAAALLHPAHALHPARPQVGDLPQTGGVHLVRAGRQSKAGDVTTITFIASPTDRAETRIFSWLSRNHSFDTSDADFGAGFHDVMEQDRIVVEAQDPAELPLDPREELHLKLADSGSIVYRKLLRELAPAASS